jgi:hypothetical protein
MAIGGTSPRNASAPHRGDRYVPRSNNPRRPGALASASSIRGERILGSQAALHHSSNEVVATREKAQGFSADLQNRIPPTQIDLSKWEIQIFCRTTNTGLIS